MTQPKVINMNEVRRMRAEGMTLVEIASKLHVGYSTLAKQTRRAGITFIRNPSGELILRNTRPPMYSWHDYADARTAEETMPVHLRGRAADIRRWLEHNGIKED